MGFSSISEVGKRIVAILNDAMVPDVILNNGSIGLCAPDDHGDFVVGIHLYDISPDMDVSMHGMVNTGVREQTYPSSFLTLRYMITAYSAGDLKFRAEEDHRILGRVIQTLSDRSVLGATSALYGTPMKTRIELERLDMYEKMRLWTFPNDAYRLTLFYKVSPVEITSARTKPVTRVSNLSFFLGGDVSETGRGEAARKLHMERSLVVICTDGTDGHMVTGNAVRAYIEGERPAVLKEDGYRVFVNLGSDVVRLRVESGIYEDCEKVVRLNERDAADVLEVVLKRRGEFSNEERDEG